MAKRDEAYDLDEDDRLSVNSETTSEVHSDHFIDFEEQMNLMMFKIQEFEGKLKKERNLVNSLENKLKCEHDLVLKFSLEKAQALKDVNYLQDNIKLIEAQKETLNKQISDLTE